MLNSIVLGRNNVAILVTENSIGKTKSLLLVEAPTVEDRNQIDSIFNGEISKVMDIINSKEGIKILFQSKESVKKIRNALNHIIRTFPN